MRVFEKVFELVDDLFWYFGFIRGIFIFGIFNILSWKKKDRFLQFLKRFYRNFDDQFNSRLGFFFFLILQFFLLYF